MILTNFVYRLHQQVTRHWRLNCPTKVARDSPRVCWEGSSVCFHTLSLISKYNNQLPKDSNTNYFGYRNAIHDTGNASAKQAYQADKEEAKIQKDVKKAENQM